ncbi:MAG: hypothetical protein ACTSYC_02785 [Promethearchaeota archaeon]
MTTLDYHIIILKGKGKDFCTGLDLKEAILLQSKKVLEGYKKKFYFLNISELLKSRFYF